MSSEPICPCESFEHPATIANQPGLAHVLYRAGDFRTFRRALLQPFAGETELTIWRPNAQGDLLLQMLEWWAYVADVLTLYNERSINENLLATATLDSSVRRLVKILGYRPRPGIAGSADLGVLLSGPHSITLPASFRVQSKPAPGKQPQTFETSVAYSLAPPDAIPVAPPGVLAGPLKQLYLEGTNKSIQPDDVLLLAVAGNQQDSTLLTVQSVNHAEDAAGNPYTEIVPAGSPTLPNADASGYQLLQSKHIAGLWKYLPTTSKIDLVSSPLQLESVDRAVGAGQVMVLSAPTSKTLTPVALKVVGTTEQIWYTNGDGPIPPVLPTIPAGAPHTQVSWTTSPTVKSTEWNNESEKVRVLLAWAPVGILRNAPIALYNGTPPTLIAMAGKQLRTGDGQTLLLEGAEDNGALITGSVSASTPNTMQVAAFAIQPAPILKAPLRVLENVIHLTRGKSVDKEVLGIGNATIAGQEFKLAKSPLTYLPAGNGYKSTLRVYVNDAEWTEVTSFYGQPADASVFVTYEDDDQKTHVQFGDWINGAGLPMGAQVTAYYRIESGADDVEPGGLTVIAKPVAGLRGVRQPARAGGGADPDPREQIRRYAPKSVLTFGRAISADDYDAIAVRAPGVTRVRSYFAWNAQEQRATVTLYVGDTTTAVDSAKNALSLAADPNRSVSVQAAKRVSAALFLAIRVQPRRVLEDVIAAVRNALADSDTGLLGSRRTGIGESIYFSQVSEACLKIEGVHSVTFALFLLERPDPMTGIQWGIPPRINASADEFFAVAPEYVFIFPEVLTGV
jgi:hypothetical protein